MRGPRAAALALLVALLASPATACAQPTNATFILAAGAGPVTASSPLSGLQGGVSAALASSLAAALASPLLSPLQGGVYGLYTGLLGAVAASQQLSPLLGGVYPWVSAEARALTSTAPLSGLQGGVYPLIILVFALPPLPPLPPPPVPGALLGGKALVLPVAAAVAALLGALTAYLLVWRGREL